MSLVFFGTPGFSIPSLDALLKAGERVEAVVTQRDKRRGRSSSLLPPPVKDFALSKGLRVLQPRSMKDEAFVREISELSPEFLVVVAYGKILTERVLAVPSIAPINLHASLLPKYRGASPIAWAIINGEAETGLCTMLITPRLDEGDILLEETFPILADDTTESLGGRLSEAGGPLLVRTLKGMKDGTLKPRPQGGEATFAPSFRKEDGQVDWSKTAIELGNFVRGMYPWPGAFCFIEGLRIRLIKVRPEDGEGRPGVVEEVSGYSFIVGTGRGLLRVLELQPEGKRPMTVRAFLHGRKMEKGTVLT
jgi:methionyl-tRNA formyltransferase